jgi:predicted permease
VDGYSVRNTHVSIAQGTGGGSGIMPDKLIECFGILGLFGFSLLLLNRLGYLGVVRVSMMDKILTRILLPSLFFMAFILEAHPMSEQMWQLVGYYATVVGFCFAGFYMGMWFIPSMRDYSAQFAMQLCSNHIAYAVSPILFFVYGQDILGILLYCMCVQWVMLIGSVLIDPGMRNHAMEVLWRYYNQSFYLLWAILFGFLSIYVPWKDTVRYIIGDVFGRLSVVSMFMAVMVMVLKSVKVSNTMRDSLVFFFSKVTLVVLVSYALYTSRVCEVNLLYVLALLLLSPGVIVKDDVLIHHRDTSMYWKQIIAGYNRWYIIMMLMVALWFMAQQ